MPDVKAIISSHNKSVVEKNLGAPKKACNCRKDTCPLDGACLTEIFIYEAKVSTNTSDKFYICSTEVVRLRTGTDRTNTPSNIRVKVKPNCPNTFGHSRIRTLHTISPGRY